MDRNVLKNILVYAMIFALVFSFIPFGNFAVSAEETKEENNSEKKPVEIIEKRTATSKTFDNLDGTYSTEVSQQPIHYKNESGKWEEIDNQLIEKENNKIQNTANEFTVEFEETASKDAAAISITDQDSGIEMGLVDINVEDNKEALQQSVNEVTGSVKDNSITYEQVADNVNVVYSVGADRVKEDIIYTEKPEKGFPEKFTYQVSLDGLEAQQIGKAIYLVDPETKEEKYLIEAPYMYDSSKPEGYIQNEIVSSIPEEAKSYDLELETRIEDGQLFIDLIPNATWLNDEKRQYPITIDPTIIRLQGEANTVDTNLRSSVPTQTGGNDNEITVGNASDGNLVRSLLKFDLQNTIPAGATIVSADLNLWFTATNGSIPVDINLQKVTSAWEENEASWTYRESTPYTRWTTAGGDYAGTTLATVTGLSLPPTDINNALTNWQVPISVVQNWLTYPSTNHGFLLKAKDETRKIYKKFASSEQEVSEQYKPKFVITYKTTARLGLEDYWDYDSRAVAEGTNYVNITTLNNILQYTDLSILGRADSGLNFTRTYNSKDYEKSAFGYGWTFTGDEKIFINTGGDNSKLQYKDADGTIHVFSYNATTGMYYPPAGNFDKLAKIDGSTYVLTDPYGYKTTFKVRESTNDTDVEVAYISNQEDRNGNTIHYEYDVKNQLIAIYTDLGNELGEKITFIYADNNSGLISQAKYNNQEITYVYKTGGYLESVKVKKSSEGVEEITQFEYTNNRISAVIDPEGKRTSLAFTSEDDLTSVIQPSDDGTAPPTKYTLDRVNRLATITSPEGDVTRYYFDDNYVINREILPSGEEILYEFDKNYLITKETTIIDGQTSVVTNTYDVNGNLLETIDAENNKETYTYTTYQNIATYTDSTGAVSTYIYDDATGNLKESTEPSANNSTLTTTYDYDTHGELIGMVTSNGLEESYTTDYSGTPATKTTTYTDAFGNITKTVTDLNGNVRQSIDGKSQLTAFEYNLKNELTDVTDAKNQTTNYDYDNNGNLLTVTNPLGKVTSFGYNAQNQIKSETNALGDTTTYAYNADGELEEIKKADSQLIQYLTDDINNLSTVSVNGVEKFKTRTEGTDKIVEDQASQTSVRYQYYDNGLPQTVLFNEQSTNSIHYTYYGNESVESIQYGNNTIKRQVDGVQNMKALLMNDVTQADFMYTTEGLLRSIDFKNGVARIEKDYENGIRLKQETLSTNNLLWKTFAYGYDANHNITSIKGMDGSLITYKYDALDQLESEVYSDGTSTSTINYTYDEVGNRKTKTTTKNGSTTTVDYAYNDANQLVNVNGQAYVVDKNGNLQNDGRFQYERNAFDQLTKVTTIEGEVVAEYRYDDQGRRDYSKDRNGETYYRYSGMTNQVLFEEDLNGTITKAYTYGDNGHPLTMTYQGATYYYLTNYRGDVLALTDVTGQVVAEYTYDTWGNILTQSGTMASINPYRYAGYRYDEDTDLYYLMARYYNPDTGVFLSLDPVRGDTTNPITMNGYNYANNNPVMNVDPNGGWAIQAFLIGGAFNSLPMLLSYIYKNKSVKGFNWWRFGRAFVVGGLTAAFGMGFYKALSQVGATLISKMITMATYNIKATILNAYSQGNKITASSIISGAATGGMFKGTNIFSRAFTIYKKSKLKGVKRFLKKISF